MLGYSYKRVRKSLKSKRNEQVFVLQSAELNQFTKMHREGYIDLYYADASHFSLVPSVRYAWQRNNEKILLPSSRSFAFLERFWNYESRLQIVLPNG